MSNATLTIASSDAAKLTKTLLVCGAIAGPVYIILGIFQMLVRPGFDPTRHDLSLMSNGELGWIQISNFLLSGLLTIAGAFGLWRALQGGRGGTWGPTLIGIYGLGLIGAGIFVADPALGFPPGTPADARQISGHGLMHFVTGGIGFLALIAACFVFARRFGKQGQRGWAVYSLVTGVLFLAAFFGIASGAQQGGSRPGLCHPGVYCRSSMCMDVDLFAGGTSSQRDQNLLIVH